MFGRAGAVGPHHLDGAGVEVGCGDLGLPNGHPVETPISVVSQGVLARPCVRPRETHPEFLPADQAGFGGDPDDLGGLGKVYGTQCSGVPQARHDHPGAHPQVPALARGGRGKSIDTRSITPA